MKIDFRPFKDVGTLNDVWAHLEYVFQIPPDKKNHYVWILLAKSMMNRVGFAYNRLIK